MLDNIDKDELLGIDIMEQSISFYDNDNTFNNKFDNIKYDIDADVDAFAEKIGLKREDYKETGSQDKTPDKDLNSLLLNYVNFNHKAALWYKKKHEKNISKIKNYQTGRVVVLLSIPVTVALLTYFLKDKAIVSSITVIISGLLAAYRASSQWLEAKISSSSFINTASVLKSNIFEFQNEWAKDWSKEENNIQTLKSALNTGIRTAKNEIDSQRKSFFEQNIPKPIEPMKEINNSLKDLKDLLNKTNK
ncbi:hypothetical protein [Photobacterium sp. OFAV2-7]|uniref:hypothetical protein n=1 Tax=Photobacterium sp. OFAV2-7 TaxID=2917748 RepID=UPI001EF5ECB9|nr:hypothetical protein [Photobacterium sp. OFAV2-7]MCG7585177.1 hypothetical protein [Photobacterium sp. OFAV2-7]